MDNKSYMAGLGLRAKAAGRVLARESVWGRNRALEAIAQQLEARCGEILDANCTDMDNAESNGVRPAMLDRLRLDSGRVAQIADAVREIALLPDPIGALDGGGRLPNGLRVSCVRVPLGVVGIIYESRPNVTADAAVLCLKAGNSCILRGGKEAISTNCAIAAVMQDALESVGLPRDCILLVERTERECANEMMRLNGLIDVLIPRGGAGLIRTVVENATLPVIETGIGNCHVYLDSPCDSRMAVEILVNAKCSRPSVCNAAETLLVHRDVAESLLPLCKAALDHSKVELRGCPRTCEILGDCVKPATQEDYYAEFCDYILAVQVVESVEQAVEHIAKYGTGHSEAIVTQSYANGMYFTDTVDAAAVYVNASTRFTDGNQLGLGAEIGISTQKLHVRGPMGLVALTTTKYVVLGDGQVRI